MNNQNFRQTIILISSGDIKRNFSMQEAIESMEEAFKAVSSGNCHVPQRMVTSLNEGKINLILKPAGIDTQKRGAVKILTQKELGALPWIPAIVGVVLLLDTETGEVLSLMDGEYLTALRTGAASGLATNYFARRDAESLAIYGCGAQGKTQLEAVLAVRNIKKVWVFDINRNAAEALVSEMKSTLNVEIEPAENNKILKHCDIICTATNARSPLFRQDDLKEGVHINAVGSYKPDMQELDPLVLKRAKIFVDQKEPCLAESGDLIKPIKEGIFTEEHIHGEIGEFALDKISGRTSDSEITVFKSVGIAIQDFMVANKIFEKSQTKNFGQKINLFD